MSRILLTLTASTAVALAGIAAAPAANAAPTLPGFDIHAAADGPTRKTTRKRSRDRVEKRTTVTDKKGRTATREMRRDIDRENQSVRTQRRITGPNGRSATSDSTLQRTDDGFTRDTVVTGPRGGSASRTTDVSRDPETGLTRERVTTGPNGGEWTRSDNAQWDADTQTYTRQGSRTTPDGREQSVDVTAQRTDTGATRTATRTRADGTEVTRTQEIVRDGD